MGDGQVNGLNNRADGAAAPAPDLGSDYADRQLRALSEKLQGRGLEARLVTYPVDGLMGEHFDAVVVSNPAAPERGMMHFERSGCVSWEYEGRLDAVGIARAADEAINALRATGVVPAGSAVMRKVSARPGLYGTDRQHLVFLNTYWGKKYAFAAPEIPEGQWTATARFGEHDQLDGQNAAELLGKVRDHYQANRRQVTGPGSAM